MPKSEFYVQWKHAEVRMSCNILAFRPTGSLKNENEKPHEKYNRKKDLKIKNQRTHTHTHQI